MNKDWIVLTPNANSRAPNWITLTAPHAAPSRSRYSLICADNTVAMKTLQANRFGSCMADFPYGMKMAAWDNAIASVETWSQVHRVLKPGAFILSFCAAVSYHRMATRIEDAGFRPIGVISWLVTTKMVKKNWLKPAQELIFVGQKKPEGSVEQNWDKWGCGKIEIETTRIPWEKEPPKGWRGHGYSRLAFGGKTLKSIDQKTETVDANPNGRYPSDVIGWFDDERIQKFFYAPRPTRKERGEYNDHPTVKPISLMRYLVRLFGGRKDQEIFDPCFGSGTTGIAALQEGYRFCGIESNQHYVDIAVRRIEDHCLDGEYDTSIGSELTSWIVRRTDPTLTVPSGG